MAKGLITLKSTGLKEFIAEMEGIAENMPEISRKALIAQQEVVENKVKNNWVSMVGGSPAGLVYESIGQSSAFSKTEPATVVGTVGVYKIDSVAASHGLTNKDLNAAQIAYWVEFGTSRLRSGIRKIKGIEYNDEDLITVGAKPFISNAYFSSIDEQENVFKETFNRLADEYK